MPELLLPLLLLDDVLDGAPGRHNRQTEERGGAQPPPMLRHPRRLLCRVRRDREHRWLVPLREHRLTQIQNLSNRMMPRQSLNPPRLRSNQEDPHNLPLADQESTMPLHYRPFCAKKILFEPISTKVVANRLGG